MSSAVQLKLLTLLNVSAIKRPFDFELPGGHRSTSTSAEPQAESPLPLPAADPPASASAGAAPDGPSEPPKKKRKSVQWNAQMEIGPSGSQQAKNGKSKAWAAEAVKQKMKAAVLEVQGESVGSTSKSLWNARSEENESDDEAAPANNEGV